MNLIWLASSFSKRRTKSGRPVDSESWHRKHRGSTASFDAFYINQICPFTYGPLVFLYYCLWMCSYWFVHLLAGDSTTEEHRQEQELEL